MTQSRTTTTEASERTKPTLKHYSVMSRIRITEQLLLQSFSKGLLRGTTHTYLGQEAIASAALSFLGEDDIVVSNHRCHGHFLAYCEDHRLLLSEIVGSVEGASKGVGGSQHIHHRNFYSNGILGGMVPAAAGMAFAEKIRGTGAISVCFLGDGTLGEGIVYESLNMASLWDIPILYVIENNGIAQSTPISLNLAGSMAARIRAFGIETAEIESNDIGELLPCFEKAFEHVRRTGTPYCQIVNTYRTGPHSKGDDFRSEEEIAEWTRRDPLLLARKYFDPAVLDAIDKELAEEIHAFFNDLAARDLKSEPAGLDTDDQLIPRQFVPQSGFFAGNDEISVIKHLNAVLDNVMRVDERVHILGEDLTDPYGGAFKVTKGLYDKYKGRVHTTPISEAGFTGIANGMALRGMRPVVEIMFGDFSTHVFDQLVNHASKFRRMYGDKVRCPLIVRTPMGGYRGYGPTHSQSLEKFFIGVAGLTVVGCDPLHDQSLIWRRMLDQESACFYVENKVLYGQGMLRAQGGRINGFMARSSDSYFPTISLQMLDFANQSDVVLLTYGGMVPMALDVAKNLFVEEEVNVQVVVPAQISPLPTEDILSCIGGCRRVAVLEEGTERNGWGAEIGAMLLERVPDKIRFKRVSAKDSIIPSSKSGEEKALPNATDCYAILRSLAHEL